MAANAHVSKGSGESIIRDVTLEEDVLYIESDYVIYIGPIKDSGEGIMPYDLIVHCI